MAQQTTQTKNRSEESGNQSRTLERRPTYSGLLRRDPFWSPSEFFADNPFHMMRRFAEEMDRAFTGDWMPHFPGQGAGMWSPAIDMSERDGKLIVHADLPGLKKEDVKVEAIDNSLVIQGERRQEHHEDEKGYHRSERRYGSFCRTIPLPEGAETDQAKAEFRDGVLEVSVPLSAARQKRGREVPIGQGTSMESKQTASEKAGHNGGSKAG